MVIEGWIGRGTPGQPGRIRLQQKISGNVEYADIRDALANLSPDAKSLNIVIASPGGEAEEAIEIYQMLRDLPLRKRVQVVLAAGAAVIVAVAGDEITTSSTGVWALTNCAAVLSTRNLVDVTRLNEVNERFASIIAERRGLELATVREMMDAETWMHAADALTARMTDIVDDQIRPTLADLSA